MPNDKAQSSNQYQNQNVKGIDSVFDLKFGFSLAFEF
jgi:hypothetical protein